MYTTLAEARTELRTDLNDVSGDVRFTDAELDRALAKALTRYSDVQPRVVPHTQTGNDERVISLVAPPTAGTHLLGVHHVENNQAEPLAWEWYDRDDLLIRLADALPNGQAFTAFCMFSHLLGATTTIPKQHQDIVLLGAQGYALQGLATRSTGRANVPPAVQQAASRESSVKLREFEQSLKTITSDEASGAFVSWGLDSVDYGRF